MPQCHLLLTTLPAKRPALFFSPVKAALAKRPSGRHKHFGLPEMGKNAGHPTDPAHSLGDALDKTASGRTTGNSANLCTGIGRVLFHENTGAMFAPCF